MYGPDTEEHVQSKEQTDRIEQLEKELKRVTMEREILKETIVFFAGETNKISIHYRQARELPRKTNV